MSPLGLGWSRRLLLAALLVAAACSAGRAQTYAPDGLQALRAENAADAARILAMVGPTATLRALQPQPEQVAAPVTDATACGAAIRSVPAEGTPGLLYAIAVVESGRPGPGGARQPWPWTVDVDGNGRFFASRMQAIAWTKQALQQGARAVDVGCMQIDLQRHPHAFANLDEAFDPVVNVRYAARFLLSLRQAAPSHSWLEAAGLYHSHTAPLADAYREKVALVMHTGRQGG